MPVAVALQVAAVEEVGLVAEGAGHPLPFEGSYDQLESQLFAPMPAIRETGNNRNQQRNRKRRSSGGASAALARPKR